MNGQMSRYKQSLAETPGPVMPEDIPDVKVDYRGLLAYAHERGVQPAELSGEEQNMFYSVPVETLRARWQNAEDGTGNQAVGAGDETGLEGDLREEYDFGEAIANPHISGNADGIVASIRAAMASEVIPLANFEERAIRDCLAGEKPFGRAMAETFAQHGSIQRAQKLAVAFDDAIDYRTAVEASEEYEKKPVSYSAEEAAKMLGDADLFEE